MPDRLSFDILLWVDLNYCHAPRTLRVMNAVLQRDKLQQTAGAASGYLAQNALPGGQLPCCSVDIRHCAHQSAPLLTPLRPLFTSCLNNIVGSLTGGSGFICIAARS